MTREQEGMQVLVSVCLYVVAGVLWALGFGGQAVALAVLDFLSIGWLIVLEHMGRTRARSLGMGLGLGSLIALAIASYPPLLAIALGLFIMYVVSPWIGVVIYRIPLPPPPSATAQRAREKHEAQRAIHLARRRFKQQVEDYLNRSKPCSGR